MRLLVIRFSSLGDCVLLCPMLAYARRSGADSVVVMTKRAYAELFVAADGVDRVIAIDSGTTPAILSRIAREFREPDDVVIDAHASLRSRFVAWSAGGAAVRIDKHTRERLQLIVFKRPATLPTMLERYAALLEPAGLPTTTLAPGGIRLPGAAIEHATHAVPGDDAIAVAPGSRWPAKRWTGFAALCTELAARGHRIVLVGDAADRAETEPIARTLGSAALDIAGRVPLLETAAHIARCRLFVGNDSGLMHLAEAVGVPVVALFGPTVEAFGYFPARPDSRTIERTLACRPCSRNGSTPCPRRTNECLEQIVPGDVVDVVSAALNGGGPRRVVLR
jgi:lipopolysaccharide heptosyltransferase II